MRLKDSLYKITNSESRIPNIEDGADILYEIRLDEKHFIYQAHFPNEPITPGVCIIQIAKELLEDILHQRLEIQTVKNVKFLSVISPTESPLITYHFSPISITKGGCKSQVTVSSKKGTFAKLSFICKTY